MNKLIIDFTDEVGELFDKITLLTLKESHEALSEDVDRVLAKEKNGGVDLEIDLKYLEALRLTIQYFGG